MSNKAIDKAYLQQQFVNFNRDVINKRYITKLSAIPTGKIGSPTTTGYVYDADQYSLYNTNVFQWIGAEGTTYTPTGASSAITLHTGYFYKITMTRETESNPTAWAITGVTNQQVQDATNLDPSNGIIIDETDPNNPIISANIDTKDTYNDDILISTKSNSDGTAISIDSKSRVNDSSTMEIIAAAVGTSGSDWTVGDITTYTGANYTYTGASTNYVPDTLITGHQYKLTTMGTSPNEYVAWREVAPINIDTRFNANNNLEYSANHGLLDTSHMDQSGLTAYIAARGTSDYEKLFQYVGTSTDYTYNTDDESTPTTATIHLYEGRFYKISCDTSDGNSWEIQEIGAQKEVDYSIAPLTTPEQGYLKTYQLYKSVDGGSTQAIANSVINIPKDFLVKSASVKTYTAVGGFWFKGLWYAYNSTNDSFMNGTTELYLDTNDYTVDSSTNVITAFGSTWPKAVYDSSTRAESIGSVSSADCIIAWPEGEGTGNIEGKKYIDFVINTKDSASGTANDDHIYLALDDLIQTYSAGAGISISTDNIISLNFQYVELPTYSSSLPPAIQYIGVDEASNSNANPSVLQTGGFYKWNSSTNKWDLINTAKEDVNIDFSLNDYS